MDNRTIYLVLNNQRAGLLGLWPLARQEPAHHITNKVITIKNRAATYKRRKIMKTTTNNNIPTTKEMIAHYEKVLNVCNKEIEYMTHPELNGCCLCKCNSIVINKERMMTVTTDDTHHTTYEFSPIYPTYFSPEVARDIVKNDIYRDCNDNRIKLEIISKMEYYTLLKSESEKRIELFKSINF